MVVHVHAGFLLKSPWERDLLDDLGIDGDKIKTNLQELGWERGVGSGGGQSQEMACCEHCKDSLVETLLGIC